MHWQGKNLEVEVLFSAAGLATQVLVRAGSIYLLFDTGDGTLRDLLARNIPPQKLTAVFITHGHADHMAGLYALLGYLRAENHKGRFWVCYPRGACEVEEVLVAFQHCYNSTMPYELVCHPLDDGETVNFGEVQVQAKKVLHWHSIKGQPIAPAPALGYRLTFQNEVFAITGDTAFFPGLAGLIKDADIALIEATLDDDAPLEQRRLIHLTQQKAQMLARLAKNALFIHLARPCS
jgi:ribonuclease BN (tRNA processing enzyme)